MAAKPPTVVSPWLCPSYSGLKRFMAIVKLGDLLEFDRKDYKHWAIFVGAQEGIVGPGVVHLIVINRMAACAYASVTSVKLNNANSKKGKRKSKDKGKGKRKSKEVKVEDDDVDDMSDENEPSQVKAAVRLESFASVLGKSKVRINNSKDQEWPPFEREVIVERAMSRLCEDVDNFDIIRHNCEHFVNEVRYGQNVSFQVNSTLEALYVALNTLRQLVPLARRFINNSGFN